MRLPVLPDQKKVILLFGKCGSTAITTALAWLHSTNPSKGHDAYTTYMYALRRKLELAGVDNSWEWGAVTRHPVKRFLSAYHQLRFWNRDVDSFLLQIQGSEDYHVIPISESLRRFGFESYDPTILNLEDKEQIEGWFGFRLPVANVKASTPSAKLQLKDLTKNQIKAIESYYAEDMLLGGYESLTNT